MRSEFGRGTDPSPHHPRSRSRSRLGSLRARGGAAHTRARTGESRGARRSRERGGAGRGGAVALHVRARRPGRGTWGGTGTATGTAPDRARHRSGLRDTRKYRPEPLCVPPPAGGVAEARGCGCQRRR